MAAPPRSTWLLGWGVTRSRNFAGTLLYSRFRPSPFRYPLTPSCKMRHRHFSLQNKKLHAKKINIGDNDSDPNNSSKDSKFSNQETDLKGGIPIEVKSQDSKGMEDTDSSAINEDPMINNFPSNDITPMSTKSDGEQLSGIHLQDLIGMIRNAEKNVHLLNLARIRTLEDLEKIIEEKEALQTEINVLEMKLAETDGRLKMAAQEKIRVELLEDQLEKLRSELFSRGSNMEHAQEMKSAVFSSQIDAVNYFTQELELFRAENMSLKDELEVLKGDLFNIRETGHRIQTLEEERLSLESSLKEFEFKLAASQEDVSEISSLKTESKSLCERVASLQELLDNTTKHTDETFKVLQQNQELRKKVDRLEESLSEASMYRLSAEKMQQYGELMQQKIKLLDERLQRSDAEIHSYVQLHQESMKEFQDTLSNLKDKSDKRAEDETVHDKPSEFWSNLLLLVDGWFLEKKILADEARPLREMIWNREGKICDAYLSSEEMSETEIITKFLRLISSVPGERLHVIHIAAELAPVAKIKGNQFSPIFCHSQTHMVSEPGSRR